ncbi:hypothetical protein Gpo141_00007743 [Globisporangium polare]
MASHPFQAHQGNETGEPTPQGYSSALPQAGAPYGTGYAGYGAPNSAPPSNSSYGYRIPQSSAGYEYGTPPPSAAYGYGAPNTGFAMDALGNIGGTIAYGYGAPGYGGAPGYAVGGAPGIAVYPDKPQGYPVGAPPPGYAYGAPSVVYPVGAYYPPGGGANGQPQAPPSQSPLVDPRNQIQTGRWASGLCSCCDNCVPNLLMAWCCPFIPLAQVYTRMGLLQYKLAIFIFCALYLVALAGNFAPNPTPGSTIRTYNKRTKTYTISTVPPDTGNETISQSQRQILYSLVTIVGQLLFRVIVWHVRAKVRGRFQISGSACGDCCTACCCSCCAIAQLATHVKSYKPGSCTFGPPDVLPGFPN